MSRQGRRQRGGGNAVTWERGEQRLPWVEQLRAKRFTSVVVIIADNERLQAELRAEFAARGRKQRRRGARRIVRLGLRRVCVLGLGVGEGQPWRKQED